MNTAESHEIAMALRAAYLALHRQTDAALVQWDVTADQFVVLSALARGDALTQRELVERTSSDPSTIGAMLARLEGKGLVERLPNPRDARARTVKLTRKGRAAFRRMWSGTEALRLRLSTLLGPAAMGPLVAALQAVAVGLEEGSERGSSRAGGAALRSGRPRQKGS